MTSSEQFKKSQLRTDLSQKRKEQLHKMGSVRAGVESQIQNRIVSVIKALKVKTIGAYRSLPEEVDIWPVVQSLPDCTFVFPRVHGASIHFHLGRKDSDFKMGSFGILEPTGTERVEGDRIEAFLIPGIAFDRKGIRLGFGKGYFDRMLAGHKGIKLGVAFKFQIENYDLPKEDHDVALDYLVTEDFVLQFGTNKKMEGFAS